MLNVSGHLMSTSEVESVLVEHDDVSEAAVVSQPHPVKGECLYCFVTPRSGVEFSKKLVDELKSKGNECTSSNRKQPSLLSSRSVRTS